MKASIIDSNFKAKIEEFIRETDRDLSAEAALHNIEYHWYCAQCIQAFGNDHLKAIETYKLAKSLANQASHDHWKGKLKEIGGSAYAHFKTRAEADIFLEEIIQESLVVFREILEKEFYGIVRAHTTKVIMDSVVN